jgi:hypothetical protein
MILFGSECLMSLLSRLLPNVVVFQRGCGVGVSTTKQYKVLPLCHLDHADHMEAVYQEAKSSIHDIWLLVEASHWKRLKNVLQSSSTLLIVKVRNSMGVRYYNILRTKAATHVKNCLISDCSWTCIHPWCLKKNQCNYMQLSHDLNCKNWNCVWSSWDILVSFCCQCWLTMEILRHCVFDPLDHVADLDSYPLRVTILAPFSPSWVTLPYFLRT